MTQCDPTRPNSWMDSTHVQLLGGRIPTIPKMAAHACVTVDHAMSISRIMSVQFFWRTVNVHGERSTLTTYNIASMVRSFDFCSSTPPFRRCPICCPLSLQTCAGNNLACKAVRLRFDRRTDSHSTAIQPRYDHSTLRPT